MDPDVAHPRHQSNQTVRNREEEEEGGGRSEGGGGRLSPGCRAAFFLRWSWTKPHTTTSSTSPPRILKIDPWHLKWWENVHIRELCRLIATHFISSDDTRECVMGTFHRGEKTSCWCFLPGCLTVVCADSGFQSVVPAPAGASFFFNSVQVHLIYLYTYHIDYYVKCFILPSKSTNPCLQTICETFQSLQDS